MASVADILQSHGNSFSSKHLFPQHVATVISKHPLEEDATIAAEKYVQTGNTLLLLARPLEETLEKNSPTNQTP